MAGAPIRGLAHVRAVTVAAAAGAAVTLVSLLPVTSAAYRSPTLHVAIETAATLIALLAALLLMGRFLRAPVLPDLLLAGSLLLLALTNLFYSVVPWIVDSEPGAFDTWAPIAGRLLGAAGLALGAVLPATPVRRPPRAALQALGIVLVTLLAIGTAGAALGPHRPVGIDPDLPPDPSGPRLVGEPAVLASQIVSLVLYAIAAVGFARRANQTGDELMSWFAAAATIAAFSRLNYFLFPSLYSEWVYAGDFLRLAFYVLILAGTLREIATYQHALAEVAVHRERRRIARDLHDGLAQELAFIRAQARRLGGGNDAPAAHIAAAAGRALDESRHAIATLVRSVDASLDSSVSQAAAEVAFREGVRLHMELEPGLQAPDAVHDALVRIVREAVSNAIRHGAAQSVTVRLSGAQGLELTVEDDGTGLVEGAPGGRGFGLVSMRERAEALGGDLDVAPLPERGVRVAVRVP
jgi:signal transduction histidine kinase